MTDESGKKRKKQLRTVLFVLLRYDSQSASLVLLSQFTVQRKIGKSLGRFSWENSSGKCSDSANESFFYQVITQLPEAYITSLCTYYVGSHLFFSYIIYVVSCAHLLLVIIYYSAFNLERMFSQLSYIEQLAKALDKLYRVGSQLSFLVENSTRPHISLSSTFLSLLYLIFFWDSPLHIICIQLANYILLGIYYQVIQV